jgi:hypothetical protein
VEIVSNLHPFLFYFIMARAYFEIKKNKVVKIFFVPAIMVLSGSVRTHRVLDIRGSNPSAWGVFFFFFFFFFWGLFVVGFLVFYLFVRILRFWF